MDKYGYRNCGRIFRRNFRSMGQYFVGTAGLVIMVLDCLTGVIKAIYTKTMSSEIGFKGLLKKITILIIVALSNVLQQITGDNVAIREIVIMFYVANEGISVLENVAVIYPRMPKAIKDILLQIRDSNSADSE